MDSNLGGADDHDAASERLAWALINDDLQHMDASQGSLSSALGTPALPSPTPASVYTSDLTREDIVVRMWSQLQSSLIHAPPILAHAAASTLLHAYRGLPFFGVMIGACDDAAYEVSQMVKATRAAAFLTRMWGGSMAPLWSQVIARAQKQDKLAPPYFSTIEPGEPRELTVNNLRKLIKASGYVATRHWTESPTPPSSSKPVKDGGPGVARETVGDSTTVITTTATTTTTRDWMILLSIHGWEIGATLPQLTAKGVQWCLTAHGTNEDLVNVAIRPPRIADVSPHPIIGCLDAAVDVSDAGPGPCWLLLDNRPLSQVRRFIATYTKGSDRIALGTFYLCAPFRIASGGDLPVEFDLSGAACHSELVGIACRLAPGHPYTQTAKALCESWARSSMGSNFSRFRSLFASPIPIPRPTSSSPSRPPPTKAVTTPQPLVWGTPIVGAWVRYLWLRELFGSMRRTQLLETLLSAAGLTATDPTLVAFLEAAGTYVEILSDSHHTLLTLAGAYWRMVALSLQFTHGSHKLLETGRDLNRVSQTAEAGQPLACPGTALEWIQWIGLVALWERALMTPSKELYLLGTSHKLPLDIAAHGHQMVAISDALRLADYGFVWVPSSGLNNNLSPSSVWPLPPIKHSSSGCDQNRKQAETETGFYNVWITRITPSLRAGGLLCDPLVGKIKITDLWLLAAQPTAIRERNLLLQTLNQDRRIKQVRICLPFKSSAGPMPSPPGTVGIAARVAANVTVQGIAARSGVFPWPAGFPAPLPDTPEPDIMAMTQPVVAPSSPDRGVPTLVPDDDEEEEDGDSGGDETSTAELADALADLVTWPPIGDRALLAEVVATEVEQRCTTMSPFFVKAVAAAVTSALAMDLWEVCLFLAAAASVPNTPHMQRVMLRQIDTETLIRLVAQTLIRLVPESMLIAVTQHAAEDVCAALASGTPPQLTLHIGDDEDRARRKSKGKGKGKSKGTGNTQGGPLQRSGPPWVPSTLADLLRRWETQLLGTDSPATGESAPQQWLTIDSVAPQDLDPLLCRLERAGWAWRLRHCTDRCKPHRVSVMAIRLRETMLIHPIAGAVLPGECLCVSRRCWNLADAELPWREKPADWYRDWAAMYCLGRPYVAARGGDSMPSAAPDLAQERAGAVSVVWLVDPLLPTRLPDATDEDTLSEMRRSRLIHSPWRVQVVPVTPDSEPPDQGPAPALALAPVRNTKPIRACRDCVVQFVTRAFDAKQQRLQYLQHLQAQQQQGRNAAGTHDYVVDCTGIPCMDGSAGHDLEAGPDHDHGHDADDETRQAHTVLRNKFGF